MKRVFSILSLSLMSVSMTQAQSFSFPKTPAAVVTGFYTELAQEPDNMSRGDHAAKVFDKYFSKNYKEQGGNGNKVQNFGEFRSFVSGTFGQLPDLDVILEEVIANGNHVTVKVKLQDLANGVVINYLALYNVDGEKIMDRYAYSDGAF